MKDTSNIQSFFPVTKEKSKIGRLLFNTMANHPFLATNSSQKRVNVL